MNIQEAIQLGVSSLTDPSNPSLSDIDTPKLDAELLLAHCLKQSRTYLFTWHDKLVELNALNEFKELISRRIKGEPVAYLIGHQGFWTLELKVAPHTLIPRPETEVLIESVIEIAGRNSLGSQSLSVLDLGTGTGAIALAIASEFPNWTVKGIDLVKDAVDLATENGKQNKISNCEFLQSDWFESLESPEDKFDFIVSNPPYIPEDDPHLNLGDVRFEPRSALTSKENGLKDIQLIAKQAIHYLNPNGWLLVEHGYDQGDAVREIFEEYFSEVQTIKDLGERDRITIGQLAAN